MELSIGIAVISILAAITLPNINRQAENSKVDQTEMTLRTIANEIAMYFTDSGAISEVSGLSMAETISGAIEDMNKTVLSAAFDVGTLDTHGEYFTVTAKGKTDGFGRRIMLYGDWEKGLYIVASAGKNGAFEFMTERDVHKVDDVMVVVQMK